MHEENLYSKQNESFNNETNFTIVFAVSSFLSSSFTAQKHLALTFEIPIIIII